MEFNQILAFVGLVIMILVVASVVLYDKFSNKKNTNSFEDIGERLVNNSEMPGNKTYEFKELSSKYLLLGDPVKIKDNFTVNKLGDRYIWILYTKSGQIALRSYKEYKTIDNALQGIGVAKRIINQAVDKYKYSKANVSGIYMIFTLKSSCGTNIAMGRYYYTEEDKEIGVDSAAFLLSHFSNYKTLI